MVFKQVCVHMYIMLYKYATKYVHVNMHSCMYYMHIIYIIIIVDIHTCV